MSQTLEIRPERPADIPDIRQLVHDAFGRDFEAVVVDRLRASDRFLSDLSLVATDHEQIVGHIMITSMEIALDSGGAMPTTILAPLAVTPSRQRQGIGMSLTQLALDHARDDGHVSMILVGHPSYYPRFGFSPASGWGVRLSTPIPDDVFMAIELDADALKSASGVVTLPSEFDEN